MTLTEAKSRAKDILNDAKATLEEHGLVAEVIVEVEQNELEETESEPFYLAAFLAVSTEGMNPDDNLVLSIEATPSADGEISENEFSESVAEFNRHLDRTVNAVCTAEDKTEALLAVCREIDAELEAKIKAEIEGLNVSVKSNLRIAITAAAVLLAIAAVCLLIKVIV
jgi:hypothetical protein